MPKITRPETLIEVGLDHHYCGSPNRKVRLTFKMPIIKRNPDGSVSVDLDKRQTTQIIRAMKSQRRRKGVK